MTGAGQLALRLARLSVRAADVIAYRQPALELLANALACDSGILHELSPRSPLARAALHGVSRRWLSSTLGHWDAMAVAFAAMLADAGTHQGVALSSRAFARRGRERRDWHQRIERPLRAVDVAMVHLTARTRVISVLVLARRRAQGPFTRSDERLLRALQPTLTACDALVQSTEPRHAGVATTLTCVDGRLTRRQRQVLEHVALGHTNAEAAAALGVSPHTVRNLLVQACTRLDASNRAEAVHRATFQ